MRVLAVDDEPEVIDVVRLRFNLRWPEAGVIAAATSSPGAGRSRPRTRS
jgi:hypothetical protein